MCFWVIIITLNHYLNDLDVSLKFDLKWYRKENCKKNAFPNGICCKKLKNQNFVDTTNYPQESLWATDVSDRPVTHQVTWVLNAWWVTCDVVKCTNICGLQLDSVFTLNGICVNTPGWIYNVIQTDHYTTGKLQVVKGKIIQIYPLYLSISSNSSAILM